MTMYMMVSMKVINHYANIGMGKMSDIDSLNFIDPGRCQSNGKSLLNEKVTRANTLS